MLVSEVFWKNYAQKLAQISEQAGQLMEKYITAHGTSDMYACIRYANALVQRYGEASSSLACECYDLLAEAAGRALPAAIPAEIAEYGEVARVVQGAAKQSFLDGNLIPSAVTRLVKQVGADTTLQNAARDGAEWAWIPRGDTCAFCITLASRGWQSASKKVQEGVHAEHIHANCDCAFAVRFDGRSGVEGYDPDKYLQIYESAGMTPNERINTMRRQNYAEHREEINAQKRAAYRKRREEMEEE